MSAFNTVNLLVAEPLMVAFAPPSVRSAAESPTARSAVQAGAGDTRNVPSVGRAVVCISEDNTGTQLAGDVTRCRT
jgi:hypothetical protein